MESLPVSRGVSINRGVAVEKAKVEGAGDRRDVQPLLSLLFSCTTYKLGFFVSRLSSQLQNLQIVSSEKKKTGKHRA